VALGLFPCRHRTRTHMSEQDQGEASTGSVPQTDPNSRKEGDQQNEQPRSERDEAKGGRILSEDEVGNVTAGLSETPDRPEPANGDCAPDDKK
jgi:hypothetical protein